MSFRYQKTRNTFILFQGSDPKQLSSIKLQVISSPGRILLGRYLPDKLESGIPFFLANITASMMQFNEQGSSISTEKLSLNLISVDKSYESERNTPRCRVWICPTRSYLLGMDLLHTSVFVEYGIAQNVRARARIACNYCKGIYT